MPAGGGESFEAQVKRDEAARLLTHASHLALLSVSRRESLAAIKLELMKVLAEQPGARSCALRAQASFAASIGERFAARRAAGAGALARSEMLALCVYVATRPALGPRDAAAAGRRRRRRGGDRRRRQPKICCRPSPDVRRPPARRRPHSAGDL